MDVDHVIELSDSEDDVLEGKGITLKKGAPRTGRAKKNLSPHAYRNLSIAAIFSNMHTNTTGNKLYLVRNAANSIKTYKGYIDQDHVSCLDNVGKFGFCDQVVLYDKNGLYSTFVHSF
jgi:hypothetical protein